MDVGQPKDFLAGMSLYLGNLKTKASDMLTPVGPGIVSPVLIDPTAVIKEVNISLLFQSELQVTLSENERLDICIQHLSNFWNI